MCVCVCVCVSELKRLLPVSKHMLKTKKKYSFAREDLYYIHYLRYTLQYLLNFQGCRPYNVVSHLLPITCSNKCTYHSCVCTCIYVCTNHTLCADQYRGFGGDDMGLMPLNNSPDAISFAIKYMMERA